MQERLKKMITLSNNSDHTEKGQKSAIKHICSQLLVLVGLGAMMVTCFCLLPGCGSDSKPTNVKNEKAVATSPKKPNSQAVMPLLGQKVLLKEPKVSLNSEGKPVFLGVTREEMEAKVAADRKKFESTSGLEFFPGVTREEMEAKVAADREKFKSKTGLEVFPGVTLEQLEAKVSADYSKPFPKSTEVFPGVTMEGMKSKISQQQAEPPDKKAPFPQVVGKNDSKK